eukprot:COSAG01_NODE_3167_length_6474_cov_2.587765_6_plen_238_part_00
MTCLRPVQQSRGGRGLRRQQLLPTARRPECRYLFPLQPLTGGGSAGGRGEAAGSTVQLSVRVLAARGLRAMAGAAGTADTYVTLRCVDAAAAAGNSGGSLDAGVTVRKTPVVRGSGALSWTGCSESGGTALLAMGAVDRARATLTATVRGWERTGPDHPLGAVTLTLGTVVAKALGGGSGASAAAAMSWREWHQLHPCKGCACCPVPSRPCPTHPHRLPLGHELEFGSRCGAGSSLR